MAKECSTIEFDLSALEGVLDYVPDPGFRSLHGCVLEISIGAEVLPALLARYPRVVDGIIAPRQLGAASLACE